MDGEAIVARAIVARGRALLCARFRPQGRSAAAGVDCVGLVAIACGVPMRDVRSDYDLRESDPAKLDAGLAAAGLRRIADDARAGDVLVVRAGFSQTHLLVLTPGGFLHADAGLRRVVEVPGAVPWPVASAWRLPSDEASRDDGGTG